MSQDPVEVLANLLTAVEEITCTLHMEEGWTLGWNEAVELDQAAREARSFLEVGGYFDPEDGHRRPPS